MLKLSKTVSLNLPLMLLLISYGFVSLGQLQRVQLSNQVAFYLHDIFLCFFVIGTGLSYRRSLSRSVKSSWKKSKALRLLGYFFIWAFFGLLINQLFFEGNYLPWLYWLRLTIYLSTGFLMNQLKNEGKQFHQWLTVFFILAITSFIFFGFLQYLLIPDLRFIGGLGWDVHYFRLAGSVLDPNFLGMILVTGLLVWLFAIAKNTNWRIAGGLIFILALLLTYSRSSYGAFLLTVGFYFLLNRRGQITDKVKKSLLILSFIFITLIPFLPKPGGLGVDLARTETVQSRAEVNKSIVKSIKPKDLVIGRGLFVPTVNLEETNRIVHASFPDNILVFILISTGIPGLLIFGGFIYQLVLDYFQKTGLKLLLLIAIMGHSMFNLTLLEPINLLMLLLALQI